MELSRAIVKVEPRQPNLSHKGIGASREPIYSVLSTVRPVAATPPRNHTLLPTLHSMQKAQLDRRHVVVPCCGRHQDRFRIERKGVSSASAIRVATAPIRSWHRRSENSLHSVQWHVGIGWYDQG